MNKLTKTMTGVILATTLLGITAAAMAQDPVGKPPGKGQHHRRADHQTPVADQMMRAVRHLDLSDEQKASFRVVMKDLKTQERAHKKEVRAMHAQLKELIKADTFNESAVSALAQKEGDLAAERLLASSRAMSQVYGQLTVEQRAELEAMAEERQARRAERRLHKNIES